MYNHNKAQQSKNRVHISWDILYECPGPREVIMKIMVKSVQIRIQHAIALAMRIMRSIH